MAKVSVVFPVENFPSLKKYIKTTQNHRGKILGYKGFGKFFNKEEVGRIKRMLEELPSK